MSSKASHDIGWIGLGRMGEVMAARLIKAGHKVSVWNRTTSKADLLARIGADPSPMQPRELNELVARELVENGQLVTAAGIKAQ